MWLTLSTTISLLTLLTLLLNSSSFVLLATALLISAIERDLSLAFCSLKKFLFFCHFALSVERRQSCIKKPNEKPNILQSIAMDNFFSAEVRSVTCTCTMQVNSGQNFESQMGYFSPQCRDLYIHLYTRWVSKQGKWNKQRLFVPLVILCVHVLGTEAFKCIQHCYLSFCRYFV